MKKLILSFLSILIVKDCLSLIIENQFNTIPNIPSQIKNFDLKAYQFYLHAQPEVQRFLEEFQEENSKFIEALIDPYTQLPYDAIFLRADGTIEYPYSCTTASEIGFWLNYLVLVAKQEIKVSNLSAQEALLRLKTSLENVRRLQLDPDKNWKGFLFKYNFKTGAIDPMACIYDNGNLAACLAVVIGAFIDEPDKKDIVELAYQILEAQKPAWQALYDKRSGLLWGDYKYSHVLNILGSEGRLAALMSIIVGDLPESVWKNLSIILKEYKLSDGRKVKILPPYEGAFQLYFPLMFVPEDQWNEGFAKAHNNYAAIQIDYANESNLPAFRSASANPYYPYGYAYLAGIGIPRASLVPVSRSDIGACYATAFLNLIDPEKTVKLFQELEKFTQGKIWGPYGIFDSVGIHGEVSRVYISLDHLSMLISMAGKVNQEYFTKFLEATGKLGQIKRLYQQTKIPIDEKVELPEVKEFPLPEPKPSPPTEEAITIINFDQASEYVAGYGKFDGPGKGDYIEEKLLYDYQKDSMVLEVKYRTTEYNGIWFKLINLEHLENYENIIMELKSSKGMNALKIEIKGDRGGWMHFYIQNIGKNWGRYIIPINKFEVASWEKKFMRREVPIELIITIVGDQLAPHQKKGILWIDNILLTKK